MPFYPRSFYRFCKAYERIGLTVPCFVRVLLGLIRPKVVGTSVFIGHRTLTTEYFALYNTGGSESWYWYAMMTLLYIGRNSISSYSAGATNTLTK